MRLMKKVITNIGVILIMFFILSIFFLFLFNCESEKQHMVLNLDLNQFNCQINYYSKIAASLSFLGIVSIVIWFFKERNIY